MGIMQQQRFLETIALPVCEGPHILLPFRFGVAEWRNVCDPGSACEGLKMRTIRNYTPAASSGVAIRIDSI
jgi:hypothetical protein